MREDELLRLPTEAVATLAILTEIFEDSLRAVYLHGSAVSGGLQAHSDVDLLAVIDEPMPDTDRDRLLASLLRVSGRYPPGPNGPRCVELIVCLEGDLTALPYPARSEFLYGEWLRDAFEIGERATPVCDPELTLVLAQARHEARSLMGPPAEVVLPEVPPDQIRCAMQDILPSLVDNLEHDTRNVLLTLARMWRTAVTGKFVTKEAAADWALPRVPIGLREALVLARDGYRGTVEDDWSGRLCDARKAATHLCGNVRRQLQGPLPVDAYRE